MGSGFDWIGSYPALIAFAVATVAELLAYFIPYVNNLLTAISIPIAIVAGTVVTMSVIGDIDPLFAWTLSIVAGGGSSVITNSVSNVAHHTSTALTGGLANVLISFVETVLSFVLAVLAIMLPVLALFLLAIIILLFFLAWHRLRPRPRQA